MTKQNSADGTYVFVGGGSIDPSTFTNFRDNTKGLTDEAIINTVRYVPPYSPESPLSGLSIFDRLNNLSRIPGMQCRVAIWPDKVCALLSFPETKRKPRKLQLLRAYRNARKSIRAVEFHDQNVQGRTV